MPAVPFLLLVIAILAYGLLIPTLGFFWDDFPLSWIYDTYGVDGLERYFSTNRPYWGLLFRLTMPLLGDSPLAWQLFGLFWRWMSAVLLWLLLRRDLAKRAPGCFVGQPVLPGLPGLPAAAHPDHLRAPVPGVLLLPAVSVP